MQRAFQRGDTGYHSGMQVSFCAGCDPSGKRRCVGTMVQVDNEVFVHEFSSVFILLLPQQHVEEVAGVVQTGVWFDHGLAAPQAMVGSNDGGRLGRNPDAFTESGLSGLVFSLWVKCGQSRHGGAKYVHGMGVFRFINDVIDLLWEVPGCAECRIKFIKLCLSGKATVH